MPDIEISPSITRGIVEAGETFAKSPAFKSAVSTPILGDVLKKGAEVTSALTHRLAAFDSIATGESGKNARGMWDDFKLRQDFHESQVVKERQQQGLPEQSKWATQSEAKRRARRDVGGHNDANWVSLIKQVEREHGPMKAARIANKLQQQLGDQPYHPTKFSTLPSGKIKAEPDYRVTTGQLQYNIGRNKPLSKSLAPYAKEFPVPEAQPILAKEMGKAYGFSHAMFAPFAVAKHLTQFAGLGANVSSWETGIMTLRAGFGAGRDGIINMMESNDSAGEFFTDAAADVYRYKNGYLKNIKTLSPEVGQFISKYGGATPGLRGLRERLVPMAWAQGYGEANRALRTLALDPKDRAAQVNLQYLGIRDWQDALARYKANGDMMHPDDLRTAGTTSVFQMAFHNNEAFRSHFAQSGVGRWLTTYHWVGQNIKRFWMRNTMRAIQSRDPIQIATTMASFAGVAGATYGIKKALDVIRGIPPDNPEDHAKRFYHNMHFISDVLGWSTEWGLINGAAHRALSRDLEGPQIGRLITTAEDAVWGAGQATIAHQKHAMWPLWRDLLEELPYGVGDRFAHKLFPTRAEIQAGKPMTARRMAAKQAAQKRKLLGRQQ